MKSLAYFGLFIGFSVTFTMLFFFFMSTLKNEHYALASMVAGGFAFVITLIIKESINIQNSIFEVKQMLEKQQKSKEKEGGSDGDGETTYTIHTIDKF